MKVTAKAYAKLNLTLDVTGIRDDGYHNIKSIFQSISLYDTLEISSATSGINIIDQSGIDPKHNICYKAAELFFKQSGISGGAIIKLKKQVPLSAGLGGGSADGGAVLKALNHIYENPFNDKALLTLSAGLGADVPFCMLGSTAEVGGIGDILRPIRPLPDCDIIIIKEGEKPSTAKLYRMLDQSEITKHPDTLAVLSHIENGDLINTSHCLYNVFEPLWGNSLNEVKEALLSSGALCAVLSGSGPSVFGIYEKGLGEKAFNLLSEKYKNIYLTAPNENSGVEIATVR